MNCVWMNGSWSRHGSDSDGSGSESDIDGSGASGPGPGPGGGGGVITVGSGIAAAGPGDVTVDDAALLAAARPLSYLYIWDQGCVGGVDGSGVNWTWMNGSLSCHDSSLDEWPSESVFLRDGPSTSPGGVQVGIGVKGVIGAAANGIGMSRTVTCDSASESSCKLISGPANSENCDAFDIDDKSSLSVRLHEMMEASFKVRLASDRPTKRKLTELVQKFAHTSSPPFQFWIPIVDVSVK